MQTLTDLLQLAALSVTGAALFYGACAAWEISGRDLLARIARWHWNKVATKYARKGKW